MRLFIAATFPADVLSALNERITALRPRLPSASWVRPEAQHVTLAFLGEQPESLTEPLAESLGKALSETKRFEARLHGCGVFPNPRRARVGWIGLEPEDAFVAVAGAVRQAVNEQKIQLDAAEFKPHLTLMRIRDVWPPASIELFRKSLADYGSRPFNVESVTLFSSRLNPSGAIHTPLREVALR